MNEQMEKKPGGLFVAPAPKDEPVKEQESTTKKPTTKEVTAKAVAKKKEPKKAQAPAPQKRKPALSQAEKEEVRVRRIKNLTLMQLVTEAPEERFIKSIAKDDSEAEIKRAEKIFMQEASYAMQFFAENDYLTACAKNDPEAVIDAMINLASSGLSLNPVTKLGYLIPMDKKVRFWASYMGKREIVMSTGMVKDTYAKLVYEGDKFEIQYGQDGHLTHVPDPWAEQKAENIKGGYWYCELNNSAVKFGTMNADEIESIRKRAPSAGASHSPWKSDWEQMALKTIFNRGFKEMPKTGISDSALRALETSDRVEEDMMKQWTKSRMVKQETFDDDYSEDDGISDAEVVK